MSGADSSTGPFSGNRGLLIAVAAGVVIFALLLGLLGWGGAVGFISFTVYTALWLAVTAFVLWMLYRLVVAVERIANAQQRIADAQNPPSGAGTDADDSDAGNADTDA